MIINQDERVLLWAAIEDVTGLWEAEWELRGLRPEQSDESLRKDAQISIERLLECGYIELFHCQEPYGRLTALDRGDASAAIRDPRWWVPPEFEGTSVRFSATTAGQQLYAESE